MTVRRRHGFELVLIVVRVDQMSQLLWLSQRRAQAVADL